MNCLMQGVLLTLSLAAQDGAPDGTVTVNGGAKVVRELSVQVTVQVTNPGAGDLAMTISSDPAVPGPWRKFVETQRFELPPGDGKKTIHVRLRDSAGKESKPLSAELLLDTTPPQAKVTAPEKVSQETVILTSDVADAVGMQWTENPDSWGPWEIYLQPREIHLSPGEGIKKILVRYRDEAGNVSPAATVQVEVSTQLPEAPPLPGVRLIRLKAEPSSGDRIPVVLWIAASGIREMELKIDDAAPQKREGFESEKTVELRRSGGAHRIQLKLWDEKGAELRAELAFQEADLQKKSEDAVLQEPGPSNRLTVKGGVLLNAIHFNADTSIGTRTLKPGPMGLARVEWAGEVDESFFVQASFEFGRGKEVDSVSGELDLGVHVLSTELASCRFDLDVEAGLLVSKFWVTVPAFGTFDLGWGLRMALDSHLWLCESVSLDASVDFRVISYPWSGTVLSGNRSAQTLTAGLLLGVSVRF
jgi:hypothetical protein